MKLQNPGLRPEQKGALTGASRATGTQISRLHNSLRKVTVAGDGPSNGNYKEAAGEWMGSHVREPLLGIRGPRDSLGWSEAVE